MTHHTNQPANSQRQPGHHAGGYNPITLDEILKPAQADPWKSFCDLNDPATRLLAIPLFAVIGLFTPTLGAMAPVLVLILLGCLIARLDNRQRQIAAIPMTLAAVKLAFQMSASPRLMSFSGAPSPNWPEAGIPWLVLFFSVCLFFIRDTDTATFKMVFCGSFTLLGSGLLPGEGFLAIFCMVDYTLFFVILISLFIDMFKATPVPPPPMPEPIRVTL
jgi:hypothetical protein